MNLSGSFLILDIAKLNEGEEVAIELAFLNSFDSADEGNLIERCKHMVAKSSHQRSISEEEMLSASVLFHNFYFILQFNNYVIWK